MRAEARGRRDFSGGCAVRKIGDVSCWTEGLNETGMLGNGIRGPAGGPQRVTGVSDAVAVSWEPEHACALTRGHDVFCWGSADGYTFGEAAYDAARKYNGRRLHSSIGYEIPEKFESKLRKAA